MDSERLLSKAKAALFALRGTEGAGLARESDEELAARILALTPLPSPIGGNDAAAGGGFQLWIASDGLGLDAKLAIERGLKRILVDEFLAGDADAATLSIYFKRRVPHDGAVPGGPLPIAKRPSPFGLKIDKRAVPGVARVIAVASGKGGVGKSTVATNLAVALSDAGKKVGLLDADIYGPSAPLMMGAKGQMAVRAGQNGQTKLVPVTAHGVGVVSFGFLTDTAEPVMWRGPLVAKALRQLFYEVEWGDLDFLIVDLPPGTGDVQMTMIESVPIHGAVIVTTPQDVALIDAEKALTMFEKLEVPVIGLVENMAHFHCSQCGHEERIFGDGGGAAMAKARRLDLLAAIPLERLVREQGDRGTPIVRDPKTPAGRAFLGLAERLMRPSI